MAAFRVTRRECRHPTWPVFGRAMSHALQVKRARLSLEERCWDDKVIEAVRDRGEAPAGWRLWWTPDGPPISWACRECLAESQAYYSRLSWRDPFLAVCIDHSRFLERVSIRLGESAEWIENLDDPVPECLVRIDRISRYALENVLAGPDPQSPSPADWFRFLYGLIGRFRLRPSILRGASSVQKRFAAAMGLSDADLEILAEWIDRYDRVSLVGIDASAFELRLPSWRGCHRLSIKVPST